MCSLLLTSMIPLSGRRWSDGVAICQVSFAIGQMQLHCCHWSDVVDSPLLGCPIGLAITSSCHTRHWSDVVDSALVGCQLPQLVLVGCASDIVRKYYSHMSPQFDVFFVIAWWNYTQAPCLKAFVLLPCRIVRTSRTGGIVIGRTGRSQGRIQHLFVHLYVATFMVESCCSLACCDLF